MPDIFRAMKHSGVKSLGSLDGVFAVKKITLCSPSPDILGTCRYFGCKFTIDSSVHHEL